MHLNLKKLPQDTIMTQKRKKYKTKINFFSYRYLYVIEVHFKLRKHRLFW